VHVPWAMPNMLTTLPGCTEKPNKDKRQRSSSTATNLLGLIASNLLGERGIGQQLSLAGGRKRIHRPGQGCEGRRELRLP
jgi:hypothetical protein